MKAAVLFDVYGTLLDVHSAIARTWRGDRDLGQSISKTWRAKQLEYTWTHALRGEYKSFRALTEAALDFALAGAKVSDRAQRAQLLEAYQSLAAFPDALPALAALKARGLSLAALSNGDPDMLETGLRNAGCFAYLDAVLSVAPLKTYKPDARVYELGVNWAGVEAARIAFVSGNAWDAAGAAQFGFDVYWLNRSGQSIEYGLEQKARQIPTLAALAENLGR